MGVSGSLQVKDGKYYAVLSLRTNELTKKGKIKYRTKWISTGFEVKGNKKRAKEFLNEKCREYSKRNVDYCDMYFADYMVEWLDEIEPEIRLIHTEAIREMWETILCRTFIRGE